ncbi:MAG: ParA family protein [Planctomycetes bacterium]|nr:ParA family protein [Planctomycetota bacterium]
MQVVAITNQKGGVGKTTTALTLASELALAGQRVLVIDMDPQENLTMGLGVEVPSDGATLYEVLTRGVALAEAIYPVPDERLEMLHIVPAGPYLARAESELPGQIGFDEILKHRLQSCSGYDFAILDAPPSLGPLTINAVGAADLVLSPVQCEFFSARGVVKLLDVVDVVRERRNPDLRFRVVPTLYDKRNNICRAVLAELRKQFGHQVCGVTVGVDTRVRESQARGVPLGLYAPKSRAAIAYRELAQEVITLLSSEGVARAAA